MNFVKPEEPQMRVFLMGDGDQFAVNNQETPQGYYNIERMLTVILRYGEVATWETCLKVRGLRRGMLISDVQIGTMELLTDLTLDANKVLIY